MQTKRNRRVAIPSVVTAVVMPPDVEDTPFLLKDNSPSGPSGRNDVASSAVSPAFPLDIAIAEPMAMRAGSTAEPLAIPRKRRTKKVAGAVPAPALAKRARAKTPTKRRRNLKGTGKAAGKAAGNAQSAVAQAKGPAPTPSAAVSAIAPIGPVSPVRPAMPSPSRPRPKRAAVAKGARIASLDIRPQLPLEMPATTRQKSALEQVLVAVPIQASNGVLALPVLREGDIAPLPRSAAVTPWKRNAFLGTLGYWLRGTQRRMLALFAVAKKPLRDRPHSDAVARQRRANLRAAIASATPIGSSPVDAGFGAGETELAALRAENERLRQQLAQIVARPSSTH